MQHDGMKVYKKVSRTGRMYEKVGKKPKIFPNGAFCKKKLRTHKTTLNPLKDSLIGHF